MASPITGAGPTVDVTTIDAESPSARDELAQALCASHDKQGVCTDNRHRVIRIKGMVDYRDADGGRTVARGCVYSDQRCTVHGKQELILDVSGYCTGKPLIDISYQASGRHPLNVGSNKTVVGIGTRSGLAGKGLVIKGGSHNVIIRNLTFGDINEGIIWAGDAIQIDDAQGIWIDHNSFARVGRQFIAVGTHAAGNLLISHNVFDGSTEAGHYCDGRHYWNILFDGPNQSALITGNWFYRTSGRAPQVETSQQSQTGGVIHIVNNYYSENSHMGIGTDGKVLAVVEGNDFDMGMGRTNFVPIVASKQGEDLVIAPSPGRPLDSDACRQWLGRNCVANREENAPRQMERFRLNAATRLAVDLSPAALQGVRRIEPAAADEVADRVKSFAGPQATCTEAGC